MPENNHKTIWFARLAVGGVFMMNVACAVTFIQQPEKYVAGCEVSGIPGKNIVQGFGILFLMWNVTYPLVILQPRTQKALFLIILVQQAIGLAGETWLWLGLPADYAALHATALRFILFDGLGLALMFAAYALLHRLHPAPLGAG